MSVVMTVALSTALGVVPAPDGGYPGGNTAEGQNALFSLTAGGYNTALGYLSLRSDTTGNFNTAVGAGTLVAGTGDQNTATGTAALLSNTSSYNTATGAFALFSNTTGASNNAIGDHALFQNINGGLNVAIGSSALLNNTSGTGNIALGFFGGSGVTTANNVIAIGTPGNDVSDSCYIGNIFGSTSVNGVGVFVNSNGRLGTTTSSQRFKEEIKPMDKASEALFALKPVMFRYKKDIDPARSPQLGLVAEEVEKVNPDLVVRDRDRKPYSVRYDQVNAMLLNEFLKEHRKVQELEKARTNERMEIAELKHQIKAQAAAIHRVSDRIELSRPSSKAVANR